MALSTPGVASSDSRQAVTSPTPTTPMTTRSSPSMEWTLYPKSPMRSQTWSISWRVACGLIEMIIRMIVHRLRWHSQSKTHCIFDYSHHLIVVYLGEHLKKKQSLPIVREEVFLRRSG